MKFDVRQWIIGIMVPTIFLLLGWGYQDIRSRLEENRLAIQDLQKTGAVSVREKLADHEARLIMLERAVDKNDEAHLRTIGEIHSLRDLLIKRAR